MKRILTTIGIALATWCGFGSVDLSSPYFKFDFSSGSLSVTGTGASSVGSGLSGATYNAIQGPRGANTAAYPSGQHWAEIASNSELLHADWTWAMTIRPGTVEGGTILGLGRAPVGGKAIGVCSSSDKSKIYVRIISNPSSYTTESSIELTGLGDVTSGFHSLVIAHKNDSANPGKGTLYFYWDGQYKGSFKMTSSCTFNGSSNPGMQFSTYPSANNGTYGGYTYVGTSNNSSYGYYDVRLYTSKFEATDALAYDREVRPALLHRWSFNNGDLTDSGIGGMTATSTGVSFSGGKLVTTQGGKQTSYVDLGSNVIPSGLGDTPFTIETWVTPQSVDGYKACFSLGNGTGDDGIQVVYRDDTGPFITAPGSSGVVSVSKNNTTTGANRRFGSKQLTLNTKYHITFTVTPKGNGDGAKATLYIHDSNGNPFVTGWVIYTGWTTALLNQSHFYLNENQWGNGATKAEFDEVRVWRCALSEDQILKSIAAGPDALPDFSTNSDYATGLTLLDVGSYVQSGLVAHFDGIRNAGADQPHDPSATVWKNLVSGGPDAEFFDYKSTGDMGSWTSNGLGYNFTISGYARLVSALTLPSNFSMQFATDIPVGSGSGQNQYAALVHNSESSNCGVYEDGYNSTTLTVRMSFPDIDPRPKIESSWEGKYATLIFDTSYRYIFQGTTLPTTANQRQTRNATTTSTSYRWAWGGQSNAENNLLTGTYYSVRFYNRALTEAEIAHNRMIDEIRFRGISADWTVLVTSNLDGAEGNEASGLYYVNGSYTFTAPAKRTVGGVDYSPTGYMLERYNGVSGEWDYVDLSSDSFYTYTSNMDSGAVRLTWIWEKSLCAVAECDVSDYVQDGLIAHFDGKRNAGADQPHSSDTRTWKNLVAGGPDATFKQNGSTSANGSWTNTAFNFTGDVYAQLNSNLAFGAFPTIQIVTDISDFSSQGRYAGFLHSGADADQGIYIDHSNDSNKDWVRMKMEFPTPSNDRANLHWSGKYLTSIWTYDYYFLFEGVTLPTDSDRRKIRNGASASSPSYPWTWGGSPRGTESQRYINGLYNALRIYNRPLTVAELVHNRMVDEIRFRGKFDVTVATNIEGVDGNQSGAYVVNGSYTFTAPATKTVSSVEYQCNGCILEKYNSGTGYWDYVGTYAGTSYEFVNDGSGDKYRITWRWSPVGGNLVINGDIENVGTYSGNWEYLGNIKANLTDGRLYGWIASDMSRCGIAKKSQPWVGNIDVGTYALYIQSPGSSYPYQDVPITEPGEYRIEFDYAARPSYQDQQVSVYFGDVTDGSDVTEDDKLNTFYSRYGDAFTHYTRRVTVASAGTYRLKFVVTSSSDKATAFDNVSIKKISAPVNMPDTYLSYAESTGSQHVDTLLDGRPDMRVEADMDFISGGHAFGVSWNESYLIMNNGGYIGGYLLNSGLVKTTIPLNSGRYFVEGEGSYTGPYIMYVNGEQNGNYSGTCSKVRGMNGSNGYFWAFKAHYGSDAKVRIYSLKVYVDGYVVRDFVPGIKNNVVGLYDKEHDVWYAPNGTLTAGPAIRSGATLLNAEAKVSGEDIASTAWNNLVTDVVDNGKIRNGCVLVQSNLEGAEGDQNGMYYVNSNATFTISSTESRTVGGRTYHFAGYKVERYNFSSGEATSTLTKVGEYEGTSFTYTNTAPLTAVKVTWLWEPPTYTWKGASGGNFCDTANWDPQPAAIDSTGCFKFKNDSAISVTVNGDATIDKLIFAGSAAVTLANPDAATTNTLTVTEVENTASVSPTINCAVQFADTYLVACDYTSVNFAGGATATYPDPAMTNATEYARALTGVITFTEDWTPVSFTQGTLFKVPSGSRLYGQNLNGNAVNCGGRNVLRVLEGGYAEFNNVYTAQNRMNVSVWGHFKANGTFVAGSGGSGTGSIGNYVDGNDNGHPGIVEANMLQKNCSDYVHVRVPTLYVGSGGIKTAVGGYHFNLADVAKTIYATDDFEIDAPERSGYPNDWRLDLSAAATFNTQGHTITWIEAAGGSGALTKEGEGTLIMRSRYCSMTGAITVNAGTFVIDCTNGVGSGAITVAAGATLKMGQNAPTSLANAVTLAAGSTLGFTVFGGEIRGALSNVTMPDSGTVNIEFDGNVGSVGTAYTLISGLSEVELSRFVVPTIDGVTFSVADGALKATVTKSATDFYFDYNFTSGEPVFDHDAACTDEPNTELNYRWSTVPGPGGLLSAAHPCWKGTFTDGATKLSGDWSLAMSVKPGTIEKGVLLSLGGTSKLVAFCSSETAGTMSVAVSKSGTVSATATLSGLDDTAGAFHSIVAVHDSSTHTISFYCDGVLSASTLSVGDEDFANGFQFGQMYGGNASGYSDTISISDVAFQNVRFFTRKLSADDVEMYMDAFPEAASTVCGIDNYFFRHNFESGKLVVQGDGYVEGSTAMAGTGTSLIGQNQSKSVFPAYAGEGSVDGGLNRDWTVAMSVRSSATVNHGVLVSIGGTADPRSKGFTVCTSTTEGKLRFLNPQRYGDGENTRNTQAGNNLDITGLGDTATTFHTLVLAYSRTQRNAGNWNNANSAVGVIRIYWDGVYKGEMNTSDGAALPICNGIKYGAIFGGNPAGDGNDNQPSYQTLSDPSCGVAFQDLRFYTNVWTSAEAALYAAQYPLPENIDPREIEWNNTAGDGSLDTPGNWSIYPPLVRDNVTVNVSDGTTLTASNQYYVASMDLVGSGAVGFSFSGPGTVVTSTLDVPEGMTLTLPKVIFGDSGLTGNGDLVLAPGDGNTLTMTKANNQFWGGVTVANGTVKFGDMRSFGGRRDNNANRAFPIIRVKGGATLDLNATSSGDYGGEINRAVLEAGATLKSTGNSGPGLTSLVLEGDATVDTSSGLVVLAYAYDNANTTPPFINLNSYTLTKTGNNEFYVSSLRIDGTGTFDVQAGNVCMADYDNNGRHFPTNTFANGTLRVASGAKFQLHERHGHPVIFSVKDLELDGTIENRAGSNNELIVTGSITGSGTTPYLTLAGGAIKPTGDRLTVGTYVGPVAVDTSDLSFTGTSRIRLFNASSAEGLPAKGAISLRGGNVPAGWKVVKSADGLGYDIRPVGAMVLLY